jgi:hypothetical protein
MELLAVRELEQARRAPMASTALQLAGMLLQVPLSLFTPTGRDDAEWLEFSRGLVIEPVLPRPLLAVLGASQATVPHCLV